MSLAIKGLKQVIDNVYKYSIPSSCIGLNEDYKVENHSFRAFYKECVVPRPNLNKIEDKCTKAKLYRVYEAWCKDNNNGYKESKQEVKKILEEMGKAEIKRTNGYEYYKAITLNEATKKEYESIYNPNKETDINFDNDVPNSDKSRYELGLDSDNSDDFALEYEFGDLRPSEETLREAGFYDPDFIKAMEVNNEKV